MTRPIWPRHSLRRSWVLVLSALLACAAEDPADRSFTVRDSAGVTIVESVEPAWGEGEGWTLSSEPILDIGVLDGDPAHQLFEVRDVARSPAGEIFVANGGSREIRVFDDSGRFLRALGGEGEGPGEFSRLEGVALLPPDTIVGFDDAQRRATAFDGNGSLAWTVALGAGGTPLGQRSNAFDDGSLAWVSESTGDAFSAVRDQLGRFARSESVLVRYPTGGERQDTIGVFPGLEVVSFEMPDGRPTLGLPLFGRRMVYDVSGEHVYVGTGDEYELRVYGRDGVLRRMVRRTGIDLRATTAAADSAVARFLPTVAPESRDEYREILAAMPLPERRAAYSDLMVDAELHLWVSDYYPGSFQSGAPPSDWDIFDPDGRWLGEVEVPEGLWVFEAGLDYVLGLVRDEFDVEHVRMYGLTRGD